MKVTNIILTFLILKLESYSICQSGLAIFHLFSSLMWKMGTVLDNSTYVGYFICPWLCHRRVSNCKGI